MTLTKRLFVLGNYSKFIRSGQVRLNITGNMSYLKPVAFYDRQRDWINLVLINDSPYEINTTINAFYETGYFIDQAYLTDETSNLRQLEHAEWQVQEKQTKLTIPHKSVITLLLKK